MSWKTVRNVSRLLFLTVAALVLNITACNQSGGGGSLPPLAGKGILKVGYVQTDLSDPNLTLPCYWKDGVLTLLTTGTQSNGRAQGIAVNGTDVYIIGSTESGTTQSTQKPVILGKWGHLYASAPIWNIRVGERRRVRLVWRPVYQRNCDIDINWISDSWILEERCMDSAIDELGERHCYGGRRRQWVD